VEFVNPQLEFSKKYYSKVAIFTATVAEDLLKVAGSLSEIPGDMHYGNKIKPESQAAAFPLAHGQNIQDLAVGAVAAPVIAVGGVINAPSNIEN